MSNNVQWIKIAVNIFDDEKIRLIDALPEHDAIIVIWIKLLILAGRSNSGGYLLLNEIPYNEEMIAAVVNRPLTTVRLAISTFINYGMVEICNVTGGDAMLISNWEKHQNVAGLEFLKEQNRVRVNRFREKHKQLTLFSDTGCNITVMDNVMQSNALELDIDTIYTPTFNSFWSEYPRHDGKLAAFKAWKKVGDKNLPVILAAIESQKRSKDHLMREKQFIPMASTWLNGKRWLDEVQEVGRDICR